MAIEFTITPKRSGLRLDQALCKEVPELSRRRAQDLVQAGEVLVDGRARRPGYRVKTGERVTGQMPAKAAAELLPEPMDLSVIHEDDHILVVDKLPGVVVHPGAGHPSGTLVNGLMARDPAFLPERWPDPSRPGIVHRLDRDTSGLIVLAKTPESLSFLQKEFKYRRVEKTYLALVRGENIPDSGEIILPIGRHPKKRKLMAVRPDTGKYAKTGFAVKARFQGGALMAVRLFTGRTHQIRVHFYHQDMPLIGDPVYQLRRNRKGSGPETRQMLHSFYLSFRHPFSGMRMAFEAPMPDDFHRVMKNLETP